MADNSYAVMNLRTIKENIMAYASYAEGYQYTPLYEKIEAAQQAVQELIDAISGDPADTTPADDPAKYVKVEYSRTCARRWRTSTSNWNQRIRLSSRLR